MYNKDETKTLIYQYLLENSNQYKNKTELYNELSKNTHKKIHPRVFSECLRELLYDRYVERNDSGHKITFKAVKC